MEIRETSAQRELDIEKAELRRVGNTGLRYTASGVRITKGAAIKTSQLTYSGVVTIKNALRNKDKQVLLRYLTPEQIRQWNSYSTSKQKQIIRKAESMAEKSSKIRNQSVESAKVIAHQLNRLAKGNTISNTGIGIGHGERKKPAPASVKNGEKWEVAVPQGKAAQEMKKNLQKGNMETVTFYTDNRRKGSRKVRKLEGKLKKAVKREKKENSKLFRSALGNILDNDIKKKNQKQEQMRKDQISDMEYRADFIKQGISYAALPARAKMRVKLQKLMRWIGSKVKSGILFLLAPVAPFLFVCLGIFLIVLLMIASLQNESEKYGGQTAWLATQGLTEFSYFAYYESGGEGLYDAVLGDGGRAFGAFQFDYQYELQSFLQYCVSIDPHRYAAFQPFTDINKSELLGNTDLARAWHSVYAAGPEEFSRCQDDYVRKQNYEPVEQFLKSQGLDISGRPDVIKGLVCSIHNRKGMELSTATSYVYRSGVTNSTSDEDFIKLVCDSFGTRGGNIHDRYCVDYSAAACGIVCEKNLALQILTHTGEYGSEGGGTAAAGVAGTIDPNQRMAWLFPNGTPTTESGIQPYLTTINVPVNNSAGTPTTIAITCHKSLANEMYAVFLEMQRTGFKIKQCSCYGFRSMASGTGHLSHHSYGVAVDINWDANPAVYWGYKPDPSDPYYIDQTIVNIWKRHGFYWGGDWSASYYDPMHFTYTNH